jgi:hypothetical protein
MELDDEQAVVNYFNSWFALGERQARFFKQHDVDRKQLDFDPARTPHGAIAIYERAPPDVKRKFAALPVERQMGILLVPIRGQARYKKSGLDAYMAWKKSPESGHRPSAMKDWEKDAEKYAKKLDRRFNDRNK